MAQKPTTTIAPVRGSTWLALLASSSLGVALAVSTPAEVRADEDAKLGRGPMRLVVQTFQDGTRRPVRSVQRAVTADELRRGVRVDLVDLSGIERDERVVAWVEPGDANLEYDGRVARPGRGSLIGTAKSVGGPVKITVGKKSRAALSRKSSLRRPQRALRPPPDEPLTATSRFRSGRSVYVIRTITEGGGLCRLRWVSACAHGQASAGGATGAGSPRREAFDS